MSGDECSLDLGRGRSVLGQCQCPFPRDEQLCDANGYLTALHQQRALGSSPGCSRGSQGSEKRLSKMCDLMK